MEGRDMSFQADGAAAADALRRHFDLFEISHFKAGDVKKAGISQ
jgi:hypothetical protein